MSLQPTLRKVAADLLTTLGWMSGTLHVPSNLSLEEHVSLGSNDLKLTAVSIPNEPDRVRFLALRRDAVLVVAPADVEEMVSTSHFTTARQVACLFPTAVLRGTLDVFTNLRLSDHLQLQRQVVTMRHCLLGPYGATAQSAGARTIAVAIVKLDHAIGISETS
jgi:hypothetical protein